MIERRRIWADAELADYIREELGYPGARQGAMVEKQKVDITTLSGPLAHSHVLYYELTACRRVAVLWNSEPGQVLPLWNCPGG